MLDVKYFTGNDLHIPYDLNNAAEIMKNFDHSKDDYSIKEILILYNIYRYISSETYLGRWTSEERLSYKKITNCYMKIIAKFYNSITNDNLLELYFSLDDYQDVFWTLFEKFKLMNIISGETIISLFKQNSNSLYDIIKFERIVSNYGAIIRDIFLEQAEFAEVILDKYEVEHSQSKVYLPKELTSQDKTIIIRNYLKYEYCNLNYVRLVLNIQNTDNLSITDSIRLEAKKKIECLEAELFKSSSTLSISTKMGISDTQEEPIKIEYDNESNIKITYGRNYLRNQLDYCSIVSNFINLFNYVDSTMRLNLVNKDYYMGILEGLFIQSRKAYTTGIVFNRYEIISNMQLSLYYQELLALGIRLEEVIEWFFTDYLKRKFGITDFDVRMPSQEATYLEKCRTALPEMESILKQYMLIVQHGKIDLELLQLSSPMVIEEAPSLLSNKYVYGQGNGYHIAKYYLFSNQSLLGYVERLGEKNDMFFKLIINHNVCLADYDPAFQKDIDWLIKNNYIFINKEGYLKPNNIVQLRILEDLFCNDVINYWGCSEAVKREIDDLYSKGLVVFGEGLFSKPEQDYISFHLNMRRFNNGYNLRNIYLHGTQSKNEIIHENNYMLILKLFIIIIIKINDDLFNKVNVE